MTFNQDPRIVLTLDAGGTNFVFGATQGGKDIVPPRSRPAPGNDLDACLATIVGGFAAIRRSLSVPPAAISFAFPGPADYPRGIIGDLPNLPAFRGGVALGPLLEDTFELPVFINNDGNLFALGEATAGFLPWLNARLAAAGAPRRYRNLIGVTLGTGFGGGIVIDGRMHVGDNSCAGEIWLVRHKLDRDCPAEEGVCARAVQREYARVLGVDPSRSPTPRDIALRADSGTPAEAAAAREAFRRLGEVAGDALATAVTLIDAPVVIGGGLAGAASLFLPALVAEMNTRLQRPDRDSVPRLCVRAHNLEAENDYVEFLRGDLRSIPVPGRGLTISADRAPRIGVGLSRLGTSRAVAIGAYVFALAALDDRRPPAARARADHLI